LEVLRLNGNAFGDRGAAQLAEVRRWGGLRELWLGRTGIHAEGARQLAQATHLRHLEVLDLQGADLGGDGGRALAEVPFIAGLRHLDVSQGGLSEASLLTLLGKLTAPERLYLAGNHIGDAGAQAIASRRTWSGLRVLDVRQGDIGADGMVALAGAPQLAGLTQLEIGGNHPGERGWRALVGSSSLARFVTDDWRAALAKHDTSLSATDAARTIPGDLQLQVTRHCIFGSCRRFTATVRADGAVDYDEAHPDGPPRSVHAQIDADRVRLMMVALDRMLAIVTPIPQLGGPGCNSFLSDLPVVRVEGRRGGTTIQLDSELFCNGLDGWRAMSDFADRFDAVLGEIHRAPVGP